ncbi:MAG TPA: GNAT family protein [Solirubrobacteraceae bacterium]|nr:GNAT family protein [Solirubrobacteraceae bacterium]
MPPLQLPAPPLADEVVLLRPWDVDDVPDQIMQFADPSVVRFSWPHTTPYLEEYAWTFFREQERARRDGEELNFAFVDPGAPATVFGGGSLYGIDLHERRASVGYWLAPAHRGRGIATRATRLMARWGFSELGVGRIELTCGPDNRASQRVAERVGFAREGVLRSHIAFKGGRRDSVIYSLLPADLPETA